ncbi:hypothetical protein JG536_10280 [Burkholderia ambifaria]|uniref:hypothetical protein n=1 Tax=Burkholderia ambifaria TaxID=152480 RepID=UPI00158CDF42|nr:hypothetical protein [Burkholderia ambifaria]QQJ96018.1 hypothetical protein JG536_10280 [Burkholderia ambifaria]
MTRTDEDAFKGVVGMENAAGLTLMASERARTNVHYIFKYAKGHEFERLRGPSCMKMRLHDPMRKKIAYDPVGKKGRH